MLLGCCSLVFRNQDILAVKCSKGRGFILPGGKWQPGETYKTCACRELHEETGLLASTCSFLYVGPSGDGYMCHAFYCEVNNWHQLRGSDEGKPTEVTWDDLIHGGAFGAYYEILRDVWAQRLDLLHRR